MRRIKLLVVAVFAAAAISLLPGAAAPVSNTGPTDCEVCFNVTDDRCISTFAHVMGAGSTFYEKDPWHTTRYCDQTCPEHHDWEVCEESLAAVADIEAGRRNNKSIAEILEKHPKFIALKDDTLEVSDCAGTVVSTYALTDLEMASLNAN